MTIGVYNILDLIESQGEDVVRSLVSDFSPNMNMTAKKSFSIQIGKENDWKRILLMAL